MSKKQIHIFISHSWTYSSHYDSLSSWIFDGQWSVGQASLDFRDYSVPKNDPIHNASNDTQLKDAIYDKISRSHIIVIPTGMYTNHSKWIRKEIDGAKSYGKPILAVNPHGQERKSSIVVDNSDEFSGWNKQPIINAIWKLYNQ
jgi:hypothetical protein